MKKSLRDGKLHQSVIQLPSGRTSEFYLKTPVKRGETLELYAPPPFGY